MKKIGATHENGKGCFCVWAPEKELVELEIIQDQGSGFYPMKKDEEGYWEISVPVNSDTRYKFRVDGQQSFPDPASRSQPDGVHGASSLTNPAAFEWSDDQWTTPALSGLIIYEVHTGSFSQGHNFFGIAEKLDYLKELGINAIELMPVAAFPGVRNWGYDGVCLFAVQESYGGRNGLKHLINAAHEKGIAILLDVVYNHAGPDGNYLPVWGPYFTTKYKSFWGQSFNLDDKFSDPVRNYLLQNALMWLDEFHLDGLRLDAVHAIIDHSAKHFVLELRETVDKFISTSGQKKLLIAEIDLNDIRYISPANEGGYNLDAQWSDEFHHSLHSLLTGEQTGYYEDFGTTEHMVRAINNRYVYDGIYSRHRKRKFGSDARAFPAEKFVVFTQNHDQTGNRFRGERLSTLVSFPQLKLAAAMMLLCPYTPLIFMGEEYGETNPFLFFIDYTHDELTDSTRKGRKEEFKHFGADLDFPDPAGEESFFKSLLSWQLSETRAKQMYSWYQWLIRFRKTSRAMQGRSQEECTASSPAEKLILMKRTFAGNQLEIVFNFSGLPQPFQRSNQKIKCLLDSESVKWGGNGSETEMLEAGETATAAPYSVSVYEIIH